MMDKNTKTQNQFKRALCDSDFDGCVCAAILKEVFPDIELYFTDPGTVQCGKLDYWVSDDLIIADLPYIKGTGLYFDHHIGNKPHAEIKGEWQNTDCAAQILYNKYKQKLAVNKYEYLLERLAAFDSGKVKLADIQNPDEYMLMGFAIDRKDKEFQLFVAEYLAKHSWQELWDHEITQQKIKQADDDRSMYIDYLKTNTKIVDDIAYLDVKDFKGTGGHTFFVAREFPNTKGIIVIKKDCNCTKINFFHNTFNEVSGKSIDFLKIAQTINPQESGGHRGACGCVLPKRTTLKKALQEIEKLISSQIACLQ